MPFLYVDLIFTLCFTCVHLKANTFLYLFKPVVRQLLFTKKSNVLTPELLDLRQYLAIGNLSVFDLNIGLNLIFDLLDCQTLTDQLAQYQT